MFQLIVAIIAIALVAFLALTSLYFGGEAFMQGSLRAGVTTLVNSGQQIAGAAIVYQVDQGGVEATALADLTADGEYLSSAPGGSAFTTGAWAVDAKGSLAFIKLATVTPSGAPVDQTEICGEVVRQAQNSGQFGCKDGYFVYKITGSAISGFEVPGNSPNPNPNPNPNPGPGQEEPEEAYIEITGGSETYNDEGVWVIKAVTGESVAGDEFQLSSSLNPVTWTVEDAGNLPPGISFNTSTGRFSGSSTRTGMSNDVILTATAAGKTETLTVRVYVDPR